MAIDCGKAMLNPKEEGSDSGQRVCLPPRECGLWACGTSNYRQVVRNAQSWFLHGSNELGSVFNMFHG